MLLECPWCTRILMFTRQPLGGVRGVSGGVRVSTLEHNRGAADQCQWSPMVAVPNHTDSAIVPHNGHRWTPYQRPFQFPPWGLLGLWGRCVWIVSGSMRAVFQDFGSNFSGQKRCILTLCNRQWHRSTVALIGWCNQGFLRQPQATSSLLTFSHFCTMVMVMGDGGWH